MHVAWPHQRMLDADWGTSTIHRWWTSRRSNALELHSSDRGISEQPPGVGLSPYQVRNRHESLMRR